MSFDKDNGISQKQEIEESVNELIDIVSMKGWPCVYIGTLTLM